MNTMDERIAEQGKAQERINIDRSRVAGTARVGPPMSNEAIPDVPALQHLHMQLTSLLDDMQNTAMRLEDAANRAFGYEGEGTEGECRESPFWEFCSATTKTLPAPITGSGGQRSDLKNSYKEKAMAKIEQIHQTGQRLLDLRRRLAARQNVAGMKKNCEALEAEIARLEKSTIGSIDGNS